MAEKSRRKMLKYGAAASGAALFPTVSAAKTGDSVKDSGTNLEDLTVIAENNDDTYVGVSLSDNGVQYNDILRVNDRGGVKRISVSESEYRMMTADTSTMTDKDVESTIGSNSGDDWEDVIERADNWHGTNGDCGKHDYTHKWGCVTAEFTRDLDDIGIPVVTNALAAYVAATVSSAGFIAVFAAVVTGGGILASWLLDVDTITIGATEFDKSALGWTQTFSMAKADIGWHVDWDDLHTVGINPGHPGYDYI